MGEVEEKFKSSPLNSVHEKWWQPQYSCCGTMTVTVYGLEGNDEPKGKRGEIGEE